MKPTLCPDFPIIVDDWLLSAAVSAMSPAEEGAYFRLLCHAWRHEKCLLPDDENKLAVLSRLGADWSKSAPTIRACFESDGQGYIFNRRQVEERKAQETRVKSSRKASLARWGRRNAPASEAQCGNDADASKPHSAKHADASKPECDKRSSPTRTLSLSHSSPDGCAREVELPVGFPQTEKEAKAHAGFVGCPEDFSVKVWTRAMSRGGCDSKDVPVRNFRAHLATAWAYERERMAKQPKEPKKLTNDEILRQAL